MIKLEELRFKSRLSVEDFAKKLDISESTLIRIETAERQGRKHNVSHSIAYRLVEALKKFLGNQNVELDDLAGVQKVPPRPGRPKVKQAEKHMERFNASVESDGSVIVGVGGIAYQFETEASFQKWLAANDAKIINPHYVQESILYEVREWKVLPDDME